MKHVFNTGTKERTLVIPLGESLFDEREGLMQKLGELGIDFMFGHGTVDEDDLLPFDPETQGPLGKQDGGGLDNVMSEIEATSNLTKMIKGTFWKIHDTILQRIERGQATYTFERPLIFGKDSSGVVKKGTGAPLDGYLIDCDVLYDFVCSKVYIDEGVKYGAGRPVNKNGDKPKAYYKGIGDAHLFSIISFVNRAIEAK